MPFVVLCVEVLFRSTFKLKSWYLGFELRAFLLYGTTVLPVIQSKEPRMLPEVILKQDEDNLAEAD